MYNDFLLEEFQTWNPKLIEKMRNCSHHYDIENLNPYHLEGDVFTHTCLVFNQLKDDFNLGICALCHDIGKVYTRTEMHDKKRVHFFGHEKASISDTIDFLYYLRDVKEKNLNIDDFHKILSVISNHMKMLETNIKLEKKYNLWNHNAELQFMSQFFTSADKDGSITMTDEEDFSSLKISENSKSFEEIKNIYNCDIILMSGIPGSGKDTVAKKMFPDAKILSYDKIRIEIYKNSPKYTTSLDENTTYNNAFDFCNRKKINLNDYLQKQINEYKQKGYKIIISNTNLTSKSRKKLINLCKEKDTKIGSIFVITPFNIAVERNNNRKEKIIPPNAINRMTLKQSIPTIDEGFSHLLLFDNKN